MLIDSLHKWNVTPEQAMNIQNELRKLLDVSPVTKLPKLIAGADVSVDSQNNLLYGGVVIVRYEDLAEVERQSAVMEMTFPYIPGLLSFREVPVLLKAFLKIYNVPDIIICDGQGIAHPRGFGLACHLGIALHIPTIGCAKSRLCGEHQPVGEKKGDFTDLLYKESKVGIVLRTRDMVKPVYLSPGYRVSISYAKEVILHCCNRFRITEPVRKAHNLVKKLRS